MPFDVKRFDIYRKVPKDLTQPTLAGAIISVCSVLFILFLLVSELSLFITAEVHSELTVEDPVTHSEKIPVFINITLPRIGCDYLGLDIQDDMGRHEVGFKDNTVKTPVGDEGCRFESHFLINKVPGNFHVSTHSAPQQPDNPDMSHILHKVRFGVELEEGKDVKGSFNPLELVDKSNADGNGAVPPWRESIASHLVPLPAESYYCALQGETATLLHFPHHHLRHCWGNFHRGRHCGFLDIFRSRDYQEGRTWKAELKGGCDVLYCGCSTKRKNSAQHFFSLRKCSLEM